MAWTDSETRWRGPRPAITRYRQGATRLGIPLAEYTAQIEAGNAWCSGCRRWQPVGEFGPHRWRASGINSVCLNADRAISREAMRRIRAQRKEGAA